MRLPCLAALALALGLSSCGTGSFGTPADGFDFPQIAQSYMPLHSRDWMLGTHDGASVVIAPGIAVTNAHNANLIDPKAVIGKVDGYDLLYFRTARSAVLPTAPVATGRNVIAYGQDANGKLRVSRGVIQRLWPAAFGFISDAGPGFSGGPVVDAKSGALLGITYGFKGDEDAKTRLMLAYDMAFVMGRLAAVQSRAAAQ
jgi:V8-like Glu-specific endopeptidase